MIILLAWMLIMLLGPVISIQNGKFTFQMPRSNRLKQKSENVRRAAAALAERFAIVIPVELRILDAIVALVIWRRLLIPILPNLNKMLRFELDSS